MSVNGILSAVQSYDNRSTANTKTNKEQSDKVEKQVNKSSDTAAVYEKSDKMPEEQKKVYKKDEATVERMIQETEKRAQSLRKLVEKMLRKQGETFNETTDIYELLREGKVEVDPETSAKAQKDIAEDGYWGVEQTSGRLVSFAKALTGGDPSKADEMIEAVKKGFEEATKTWGDELPAICKDTLDAAIEKLEAWRDTKQSGDAMTEAATDSFVNQAKTGKRSE